MSFYKIVVYINVIRITYGHVKNTNMTLFLLARSYGTFCDSLKQKCLTIIEANEGVHHR